MVLGWDLKASLQPQQKGRQMMGWWQDDCWRLFGSFRTVSDFSFTKCSERKYSEVIRKVLTAPAAYRPNRGKPEQLQLLTTWMQAVPASESFLILIWEIKLTCNSISHCSDSIRDVEVCEVSHGATGSRDVHTVARRTLCDSAQMWRKRKKCFCSHSFYSLQTLGLKCRKKAGTLTACGAKLGLMTQTRGFSCTQQVTGSLRITTNMRSNCTKSVWNWRFINFWLKKSHACVYFK